MRLYERQVADGSSSRAASLLLTRRGLLMVAFAPALAAWGLGLGVHLGSASMAAFATAVWSATVAAAYGLERAGLPGPAEALLRRLVCKRPVQGAPRSPM
ncbi:DUF418 domain-containing protein [Nocardiopsis halophila]|uniref:DUF418 domain-containing protein n=1 Tax=Nocardiopsis halophila TaxID=141692 RepID=UPI00036E7D3E